MRNYNPDTVAEKPVRNTDGILRAWVYIWITDINGLKTRKRVSLGNDYNTTLDNARNTASNVRESNGGMEIMADFRINL